MPQPTPPTSSPTPDCAPTETQDTPTTPHSSRAAARDAPLDLDTIFDLLRNARRRYTIRYLAVQSGPVELGTLAEHVAATEHGLDRSAVDAQTRKAAYTALYQSHLPKLDDTGVIEYDSRPNILTPGPRFATVRTYLDAIDRTHPAHDTEPGNRLRGVQLWSRLRQRLSTCWTRIARLCNPTTDT